MYEFVGVARFAALDEVSMGCGGVWGVGDCKLSTMSARRSVTNQNRMLHQAKLKDNIILNVSSLYMLAPGEAKNFIAWSKSAVLAKSVGIWIQDMVHVITWRFQFVPFNNCVDALVVGLRWVEWSFASYDRLLCVQFTMVSHLPTLCFSIDELTSYTIWMNVLPNAWRCIALSPMFVFGCRSNWELLCWIEFVFHCGWLSNLVDPASSHMLVSKIKPCMSQYKLQHGKTVNGSLKQL